MTRRSLWLAGALFVVSGALGLGYQLVWIRKASLIVGASQLALSTVVSAFFIGLALGSLVVGKTLRSRRFSPLVVYGLFEAGIGLYALAFPWLYDATAEAYAALYPAVGHSVAWLLLARFALLLVLFLAPTFLMGGTLPLLLDALVARDRNVGPMTSLFYGLNIAGAVGGVLATSYWAIPALGMSATSRLGGLLNLAVGAVALVAFSRTPPTHSPDDLAAAAGRVGRTVAVLAFLSGFAAIGYQIAWARYFSLFIVANVYLTAVLLAVFLSALAVGSMILTHLLRRGIRPLRVLAVVQPIAAILVILTMETWRLGWLWYVFDPVTAASVPNWSLFGERVDATFTAPLLQVGAAIFLPVVLLGMGLPALIAAATRRSASLRQNTGKLVFVNTIGSSIGGFVAGYALIPCPWLRLTGTFATLCGVSVTIGLVAETLLRREAGEQQEAAQPRRGRIRPGYLLAAVAVVVCGFGLRADITTRTLTRYGLGGALRDAEVKEVKEGPVTTAFVARRWGATVIGAGSVSLAIVPPDGVSGQTIQGHVPALFCLGPEGPRRVLSIALGSGQTAGAVLRYPIERLDVVDIAPEVVYLALRHFATVNNGLGTDPRVRVHLDDGRHFVDRAADDSYDIVSLEPPPPTAEGVYRLYSLEFYQSVRRVLREGGVLGQWLPLYMVTPNDARALVRTQAEVFPHTFVLQLVPGDYLIVSVKSDAPPRFSADTIRSRLEIMKREFGVRDGRWAPEATRPMASFEGLLSVILMGPADARGITDVPLLHDDNEQLSYGSGDRSLFREYYRSSPLTLNRLSFAALPVSPFSELQEYFDEVFDPEKLEAERQRVLSIYQSVSPPQLAALEERYHRAATPAGQARLAMTLAELHDRRLAKPEALAWVAKALRADPKNDAPDNLAAARSIATNHIGCFEATIRRWLREQPPSMHSSPILRAMGR
jgi:spermidine synthase